MISFEFPQTQGLELIRTWMVLDSVGARISIVGDTSCACSCHTVPVVIRFIVKGKGNEDPSRLDWVERMIRASNPKCKADAAEAALEMTLHLVTSHLLSIDCCERQAS